MGSSRVRSRTCIPPVGRRKPRSVVQSLVAFVLAVSGTFEKLAILANVSALALYLGCALAAWRLRSLVCGEGRAIPRSARERRAMAGVRRHCLAADRAHPQRVAGSGRVRGCRVAGLRRDAGDAIADSLSHNPPVSRARPCP